MRHPPDAAATADLYRTPEMAAALETWGEDSVWPEIQLLLCLCKGRVLDIACGVGRAIEISAKLPDIEVHGCDSSDVLIGRALKRGIPAARLKVCDARATGYGDREFDYSYSIGSLEHFSEAGIAEFLAEAARVTRHASFHQIPTARDGVDHGWITPHQSYFNNSVAWWLPRFRAAFPIVRVLDSTWSDDESRGAWFICTKAPG